MANVWTDDLGGWIRHLQLPQAVERELPNMTGSAVKLFVSYCGEAHRRSTVELDLPASRIRELTGLSPNAVTKAKRELAALGFIASEKRSSKARLLNPATRRPLPKYRKQRELRRINEEVTADMRGDALPIRRHNRSIFSLTREEYRRYYEARLNQQITFSASGWGDVACPFHANSRPSLSICVNNGVSHCHAPSCPHSGAHSILDFEKRFSQCTDAEAARNIASLSGAADVRWSSGRRQRGTPVASYHYCDEHGEISYTIHRYQPKSFRVSCVAANGRTVWSLGKTRKILYHLPAVMAASTVLVCEGEKDADRAASLGLLDTSGQPVAVTCNAFGAAQWDASYSACLSGKRVIICADNDDAGLNHATDVWDSLGEQADVRMVTFSELAEHGDVSDYLNKYTAQELVEQIGTDLVCLPTN